jgi:outer membrane lipoprotein-sorting protein
MTVTCKERTPMNILRRLPLSRLLLLCSLVVAIGVSITAIALALGSGQKPPQKPLAQAVHDALGAPPVEGLSAGITLTNHLLEGASLAGEHGSGITSNPLIAGASGRLWIAKDGRARLELENEKGDTNIVYDGTTVTIYDAAEDTVYRYTPKHQSYSAGTDQHKETPSVAKIEEGIAKLDKHANLSGATPANVAGQPAYTVRVSPQESGSLIGGGELSFDANTGVPLRAAVYSSAQSAPVIELAADEISYGPVPGSVFQISPPPGTKIKTIELEKPDHASKPSASSKEAPEITTHGKGITSVEVLKAKEGSSSSTSGLEDLPKVKLPNGVSASELRTALGTVLTFERAGSRYVVAGALDPSAVEAVAGNL